MDSGNGTSPTTQDPDRYAVRLAVLLLRIAEQERAGLNSRNAVLAAGSELGIDPAAILRHSEEVSR